MKNKELLEEFHSLAEKLDVKIMKGKGDFYGGSCIVNEEKVIKIAIKIREKVILFCLILFIKLIRLIQ